MVKFMILCACLQNFVCHLLLGKKDAGFEKCMRITLNSLHNLNTMRFRANIHEIEHDSVKFIHLMSDEYCEIHTS